MPATPQPRPGTYALILRSRRERDIEVGRLGRIHVPHGFLVYIGSALGPGGVRARVGHHRTSDAAPHWHIDYLRPWTEIEEVWFVHDLERREHDWARALRRQRGARPIPGFGCSDCGCESHLCFSDRRPLRRAFRRSLRAICPGHGRMGYDPGPGGGGDPNQLRLESC